MIEPIVSEARSDRPRLVVVGHGMVGHRLLEELEALSAHERRTITVFGEEPVAAYDRVRLSAVFDGADPDELSMVAPGFSEDHGSRAGAALRPPRSVHGFDAVRTARPGAGRPGKFVYRTLDDLAAIRTHAEQPWVRTGLIVGGRLLGLEAASSRTRPACPAATTSPPRTTGRR